jgi:hypothetical protein
MPTRRERREGRLGGYNSQPVPIVLTRCTSRVHPPREELISIHGGVGGTQTMRVSYESTTIVESKSGLLRTDNAIRRQHNDRREQERPVKDR